MKLRWSTRARAELEALRRHSVERWGHEVAAAYLADLAAAANRVAARPDVARPLRGPWRLLRSRSHYLLLHVDDQAARVTVARVLHVAMDVERHLPPLD